MSRSGVMALLTVAGLTLPERSEAQSVAELEAHVANARTALLEALAAEDSALGGLDSIQVGTLRLLVHQDDRLRADRAAREAWASLERQLGSASDIISGLIIYMTTSGSRVFSGGGVTVRTTATDPRSSTLVGVDYVQPLVVGASHTASQVAGSVERVVFDYIYHNIIPTDSRAWLGGPTSFDSTTDGQWTGRYIDLATSSLGIANRCFEGDRAACKSTLWLDLSETPNVDWYPLGEAQMLARLSSRLASRECAAGVSDEACRSWLTAQPPMPPLDLAARQQLFRLALSIGGDGAVSRFLAPADNVEARLEAASGTDLDDLTAQWIERVLTAPPKPNALPARSASMAAVWIIALLAITSRSSRWR